MGAPAHLRARVLDLPGSYSLSPQSLDEQIARDVLLNRLPEVPPPALMVVVVDAFNLQRNLYYATQVIELGHPTVIALNMVDVAEQNGHRIDAARLAEELGTPVIPVVASRGQGPELRQAMVDLLEQPRPPTQRRLPAARSFHRRSAKSGGGADVEFSGAPPTGGCRSLAHPGQRTRAGLEQQPLSAARAGGGGGGPATSGSGRGGLA